MCALGLALCATQAAWAQTPRENGVAYARAIAASERTLQARLRDADPEDHADARPRRRQPGASATPHDFAADLYPYLILTARLTDPALYHGRMMEMLRNEVRYTTVAARAGQPRPSRPAAGPASLFGAGEYAKDGLSPSPILGRRRGSTAWPTCRRRDGPRPILRRAAASCRPRMATRRLPAGARPPVDDDGRPTLPWLGARHRRRVR